MLVMESGTLSDKLASAYHAREAYWSEAFAVGDLDCIAEIYEEFGFERKKIHFVTSDAHGVEEESSMYYIEG